MYRIRNIRPDDGTAKTRVLTYIASNSDPNIRPRPEQQLSQALGSGLAFELTSGSDICGCSLIYDYSDAEERAVEIGTMHIHPAHRGRGLQETLAHFHVIQAVHEDFSDPTKVIFAVVGSDTASEYVLRNKVGLNPGVPSPALAARRAAAGVAFNPEKVTLFADESQGVRSARSLESIRVGSHFELAKTKEILEIDVGWPVQQVMEALLK